MKPNILQASSTNPANTVNTTNPSLAAYLPIFPCQVLVISLFLTINMLLDAKGEPSLNNFNQEVYTVEMSKLEIPEIGGSIQIPNSWSIWTVMEARAAVEKVNYTTPEAKNIALQAAERTGVDNIRISKHVEPYYGINPTLTIAWSPIGDAELSKVPKEAQSEVCARMLKNTIIQQVTQFSKDFEILEEPTPIDNQGSGAWVTIKESVTHTSAPNKQLEVLTRIYLLLSKENFILVTASFSNNSDPDSNRNKDILGTIMKSFALNKSPSQDIYQSQISE